MNWNVEDFLINRKNIHLLTFQKLDVKKRWGKKSGSKSGSRKKDTKMRVKKWELKEWG